MYQLVGTEGPNCFVIWNIDIRSKIVTNTTTYSKWMNVFDNILTLTDKLAKIIVQNIITEFMVATGYKLVYGSISQFHNIKTLAALNSIDSQSNPPRGFCQDGRVLQTSVGRNVLPTRRYGFRN